MMPAAPLLLVCRHGACCASLTTLNNTGYCALHSKSRSNRGSDPLTLSEKKLHLHRRAKLRSGYSLLDDDGKACFRRDRKAGAPAFQALSIARDDMEIRARVANANEGLGTFQHIGRAARRVLSNAGRGGE